MVPEIEFRVSQQPGQFEPSPSRVASSSTRDVSRARLQHALALDSSLWLNNGPLEGNAIV